MIGFYYPGHVAIPSPDQSIISHRGNPRRFITKHLDYPLGVSRIHLCCGRVNGRQPVLTDEEGVIEKWANEYGKTGMQIMSQKAHKILEPYPACEAGCNTIQMAGSTQIKP